MPFLIGTCFWLLALGASYALLLREPWRPPHRPAWAATLLLAVCALALVFRPHEPWVAGEDPGSYLNSAITYSRSQNLFPEKPLWSQLSPKEREAFLYGHQGFSITPDAVLWMRAIGETRQSPWFQPAYPLLMSVVARLFPDAWILYVTPLFALLTALVLAALARHAFRIPGAGLWVFILYLCHPAVAWNARAPCPEVPASFFAFAGLLALRHGFADANRKLTLLGGLLVSLAPLFHITALMVLAPTLGLAMVAWCGKRKPAGWVFAGAWVGPGLLYAQTRWVTDCYGLGRFLGPNLLLAGGAAVAACLAVGGWIRRHPPRWIRPHAPVRWLLPFGIALMALLPLLAREGRGALPFFPEWTSMYLSLTDPRGVALLGGAWVSSLSLLGWMAWFASPSSRGPMTSACLAILLLPAVACIGWMNNYLFETRRLVAFLVPFMSLGLASFPALARRCRLRYAPAFGLALVLAVIASQVHGRRQLYRVRDRQGTTAFYQELIQRLDPATSPMVFGEYSQLLAPLAHLGGMDLLSLDSDRRGEDAYATADRAIGRLLRETPPGRPAWWISPYPDPWAESFRAEAMPPASAVVRSMPRSRDGLPAKAGKSAIQLHVHRIFPRNPDTDPIPIAFQRTLGPGHLGLRGFANGRTRPQGIAGIPLDDTAQAWQGEASSRFLLVFHHPDARFETSIAWDSPVPDRFEWLEPIDGWRFLLAEWEDAQTRMVFRGAGPARATQVTAFAEGRSHVWSAGDPSRWVRDILPAASARWARTQAAALFPLHPERERLVLLFADIHREGRAEITVAAADSAGEFRQILGPGWQWVAGFLGPGPGGLDWVRVETEPAYDPGIGGFPADLGLLISRIATRLPPPVQAP